MSPCWSMAMHHILTSSIRHTIDLIYLEFKNSIHVKQLTQNEINQIVIFQILIYYQKLTVIRLFYAHINDLVINKIFSANDFFYYVNCIVCASVCRGPDSGFQDLNRQTDGQMDRTSLSFTSVSAQQLPSSMLPQIHRHCSSFRKSPSSRGCQFGV